MTTDNKVIHHDFGKDDNVLFRMGAEVKLLYADDLVWLNRTTIFINGVPEITHQLIELPPKE